MKRSFFRHLAFNKQALFNLFPFPVLLIISISLLFRGYFLKGLVPFPGNFLFAWFEPFKSLTWTGTAIGIAHKPIGADIFRVLYPLKDLGISLLKEGQWPLWNPYNFSGTPLLAEFQAALLNPFNIFFFIMDFTNAWSWFIIFQFIFCAIFTYLYAKEIGLSRISSTLTSLGFAFSGFIIVWLEYGNFGYIILELPLILFGIERFFKKFSISSALLIITGVTLALLGGHPHPIAYVLGFCLIYTLYKFITFGKRSFVRLALSLFLFLVGFFVAAIQILPTLELYNEAAFEVANAKFIFEKFLLPPRHLITLFISDFFGNRATYNFWGFYDYAETMVYTGVIPLIFAIIGGFFVRKPLVKFLIFVAVISASLAYKLPTTTFLISLNLPVISTNVPSRIFVITSFCLTILAGFGLNFWLENLNNRRIMNKIIKICLPILFLYILVSIFTFIANKFIPCQKGEIETCWLVAFKNTILPFLSFSGLFFIFLVSGRFFKQKNILITAIFIIFLIDAIYFSDKFLSFSKKEYSLPNVPVIEYLQKNAGIDRIFGFADANITGNLATKFKIFATEGYDPLYIKRYGELISAAKSGSIPIIILRADAYLDQGDKTDLLEDNIRRKRLLNLTGVKFILNKKDSLPEIPALKKFPKDKYTLASTIGNWEIFKNIEALPRTFLTNKYIIETDKNKIIDKLFDPQSDLKTIILEESPHPNLFLGEDKNSKVEVESHTPNKINLLVNTSTNQLLFLSDTFYRGWKAFIDDQETKIYRADYTFRAVIVPSGSHKVVFSYQPESFNLGRKISAITISIIITLLIFSKAKTVYLKVIKNS